MKREHGVKQPFNSIRLIELINIFISRHLRSHIYKVSPRNTFLLVPRVGECSRVQNQML